MAATNIIQVLTASKALNPESDDYPKQLHELATITEAAERYEDMCSVMGALVREKANRKLPLDTQERNMLSVAYKNVVGYYRTALRNANHFPNSATVSEDTWEQDL